MGTRVRFMGRERFKPMSHSMDGFGDGMSGVVSMLDELYTNDQYEYRKQIFLEHNHMCNCMTSGTVPFACLPPSGKKWIFRLTAATKDSFAGAFLVGFIGMNETPPKGFITTFHGLCCTRGRRKGECPCKSHNLL